MAAFGGIMVIAALYISYILSVQGERDYFIYCGACLCLVEEFGWHLAATSEKAKIDVGSFRLDGKGNQDLNKIPWKRSEIQMIELTEGICSTMYDYHMFTDPGSGRRSFIRTTGRMGEPISHKNIIKSDFITKDLQFACDTLVEEHEELLMSMFQESTKTIEEKLCVEAAKVCTMQQVEEHRLHTAKAIMAGMAELKSKGRGDDDEDDDEYDEDDEDEYDEDDEDYEDEDYEDDEESEDKSDEFQDIPVCTMQQVEEHRLHTAKAIMAGMAELKSKGRGDDDEDDDEYDEDDEDEYDEDDEDYEDEDYEDDEESEDKSDEFQDIPVNKNRTNDEL